MRQFFSWRIWAAFGAVVGLALLLKVVLPASASEPEANIAPTERHVDFASLVYAVQPSPDFAMHDGSVTGLADFVIDGQRTVHVLPGTFGEITCDDYLVIAKCAVVADLLGDAVVWFALVPVQTGLKVDAAPIVELLDNNIAELRNGWQVPMATSVVRNCAQETGSLDEFIRRFGPGSTSVIDLSKQRITLVRCSPDVQPSS